MRSSFKHGDIYKVKEFIPFTGKQGITLEPQYIRVGYELTGPRPRLDQSNLETITNEKKELSLNEKIAELTKLSVINYEVLDPTDITFVAEKRDQRKILRSILPSGIPNLSPTDMKAMLDSYETKSIARHAVLFSELQAGSTTAMTQLQQLYKNVNTSGVSRHIFTFTILENSNGGITTGSGVKDGTVIRTEPLIKIIQNQSQYTTTNPGFGVWFQRLIDMKKYDIGRIIDTDNLTLLDVDSNNDLKTHGGEIKAAVKDLKDYCGILKINAVPFINSIKQRYEKEYNPQSRRDKQVINQLFV